MDVLQDILPAVQAFREGALAVPEASGMAGGAGGWLGCEVNAALVSVVVILFLVGLSDLYHLLPSLGSCVIRWRANITLEHSAQLSRDRNYAAGVCLLGFCLLLDRTGFAAPSYVLSSAPAWRVALRLATAAGYLILRRVIFAIMKFGRMPSDARKASHASLYNYFISTALMLFFLSGMMLVFGASDASLQSVATILSGIGFTIAMIRKLQILSGYCSFLSSILYLCALEFAPAAGLIVCCAVL